MIALFYAFIVGGAALLVLDLRGRLTVRSRVGLWRAIGVIAAAGPGLAPITYAITERQGYVGLTFPLVAVAYLIAFLMFAIGAMDWHDRRRFSTPVRRTGYALLVVLAALPSFVLLFLSAFVLLAGAGLVRQSSEVARSA
jgi:hypothetical protein